MKLPKKLKTLIVAPGFTKDDFYEAAIQNNHVKIQALQAKCQHLLTPGWVVVADIAHDDDCVALHGGPGCSCDPDVSLVIDTLTCRQDRWLNSG